MKLPFAFAPKTTEGRYLAVALIFFLLLAVMTFMVWKHPDIAGIQDGSQQQTYWVIAGGCISGCTLIMLVVHLWAALSAGKKEFNALVANTSGDDEKKKRENDNAPVHPAVAMCDRIRVHLRSRTGLYWRRKTRLLLITGDEAAIEQLVPGLQQQQWLEGNRTVLIYGGSLASEPDREKYTALRKLRRGRPLDGIVRVIPPSLNLTPQISDSDLRGLEKISELLRYSAPVWLWQLCDSNWSQGTRPEQAVGASFPLRAKEDDIIRQLERMLPALHTLRNDAGRLQHNAQEGAPWYQRFGLDHNQQLLDAMLPWYGVANNRLIRDPANEALKQKLSALANSAPNSDQRAQLAKPGYDQLKAWLMMARPDKADGAFYAQTMKTVQPTRTGISTGLWQSLAPDLWAFYISELPAQPKWVITPDAQLISQSRQVLLQQIGRRNAESTLYKNMLKSVRRNFADVSLEDMTGGTDARRLFTTEEVVPGMFTRQAWEGGFSRPSKRRRTPAGMKSTGCSATAEKPSPQTCRRKP